MPRDWIFKCKTDKAILRSLIDHIFKDDFDPSLRIIVQKTILADDPKSIIDLEGIKDLLLKIKY